MARPSLVIIGLSASLLVALVGAESPVVGVPAQGDIDSVQAQPSLQPEARAHLALDQAFGSLLEKHEEPEGDDHTVHPPIHEESAGHTVHPPIHEESAGCHDDHGGHHGLSEHGGHHGPSEHDDELAIVMILALIALTIAFEEIKHNLVRARSRASRGLHSYAGDCSARTPPV